jgi:hypothetical protein
MDNLMLRDEAAKERIRLAQEFLDPRKFYGPPPTLCGRSEFAN